MNNFLALVTAVTPTVTAAVTAQSRLELSGYGSYTCTHARTCEKFFLYSFFVSRVGFSMCYWCNRVTLLKNIVFFSFLAVTAGVTAVTGGF